MVAATEGVEGVVYLRRMPTRCDRHVEQHAAATRSRDDDDGALQRHIQIL